MAGRTLRKNLSSGLHPGLAEALNIVKQGPLKKKSKGVVPRWQERYFVLQSGELKYYQNAVEAQNKTLAGSGDASRGYMRLVAVSYALSSNEKAIDNFGRDDGWEFMLKLKDSSEVYFRARDEQEAAIWVEAINEVVGIAEDKAAALEVHHRTEEMRADDTRGYQMLSQPERPVANSAQSQNQNQNKSSHDQNLPFTSSAQRSPPGPSLTLNQGNGINVQQIAQLIGQMQQLNDSNNSQGKGAQQGSGVQKRSNDQLNQALKIMGAGGGNNNSVFTTEPSEHLTFQLYKGVQARSTLKITNTSNSKIAFRIRTTNAERYIVRPNQGMIALGQAFLVNVIMRENSVTELGSGHEENIVFQIQDRFLIQTAGVTDGFFEQVLAKPSACDKSTALALMWTLQPKEALSNGLLQCECTIGGEAGGRAGEADGDGDGVYNRDGDIPRGGGGAGGKGSKEYASLQKKYEKLKAFKEQIRLVVGNFEEERDALELALRAQEEATERARHCLEQSLHILELYHDSKESSAGGGPPNHRIEQSVKRILASRHPSTTHGGMEAGNMHSESASHAITLLNSPRTMEALSQPPYAWTSAVSGGRQQNQEDGQHQQKQHQQNHHQHHQRHQQNQHQHHQHNYQYQEQQHQDQLQQQYQHNHEHHEGGDTRGYSTFQSNGGDALPAARGSAPTVFLAAGSPIPRRPDML
jgi:hypothetical protein